MLDVVPPENFHPKFAVVGCFLENDNRFLLLKRQDHKPQPRTWGAPSGKVSVGEDIATAMTRELYEETGCRVPPQDMKYERTFYVRYTDYDFSYHVFRARAASDSILINTEEHSAYQWVIPEESLAMDLIPDMDACIRASYSL
jgi:8-oxo-dGTP pyrophosphatase MutT (NUDIX family)